MGKIWAKYLNLFEKAHKKLLETGSKTQVGEFYKIVEIVKMVCTK